eukprot:TRINITY_DN11645_c0_g1_i1.p1 TRINITY_DN11645_c0_g1~~TRINITY_DN11645_c0_g1_i1.p1  ORF type:complete len:572 (+),score=130.63 TRINITY_DN11645_c0_g1_i1:34-1749(+)
MLSKQSELIVEKKVDLRDEKEKPKEKEPEEQLIIGETLDQIASRMKHSPAGPQWDKIGVKHHHGICVPIFSLRTESSCGVGEYLDLFDLIDWCKRHGMDVIQTLPLNDTTQNSPFSPLSSFSLNPFLISISKLDHVENQTEEMKKIIDDLRELNKKERVAWDQVNELKQKWLLQYYSNFGLEIINTKDYVDWVNDNLYWLDHYGLFKTLREKFQGKSWENWPENSQKFTPNLVAENKNSVDFYIFIQYLCHVQMSHVKKHAEENGVFLKGDIPFLVSRDSADVWAHRDLFDTSKSVGAPPDMYAKDGQNWGLPVYNWENMEKDHFEWWKQRLAVASRYYHIYRIDHIVGFFRVWAIEDGKTGRDGEYTPEDKKKWIPQGEKLLRMLLSNSKMLPIGEDLGSIPNGVRSTLQKLGICGTKVVRWERKWDDGQQGPFFPTKKNNCDSMTTVSTHDSETLEQWWTQKKEEAKTYAQFKGWDYDDKALPENYRKEILTEVHSTPSLFHVNLFNEYLALVPLLVHQDPDLERINVPGTVVDTNWSYRMRPNLKEVVQNQELSRMVSACMNRSPNQA